MQPLTFNQIKQGIDVLYVLDDEIHAVKVIATTHGHPSVPLVRLSGGFTLHYTERVTHNLFANNAVNRTELLLEDVKIITGEFT